MCKSFTKFSAVILSTIIAMIAPQQLHAQFTHTTDVRIDGSLAFGLDTDSTGGFGFDTAILRENNLRILFDDTSTTGAFADNDWRLTANDSASGGLNFFSIDDATAGNSVFKVEAGARNNALYVEADGDVGIGTNNPAVDLTIQTGNTPTIRLAQDGTSSFTPQSWDVAGNETNFFVRDVTSGSTLPFRIRPGAPTSTLDIAANGNVGIGTDNPLEKLHVRDTNSSILVENSDPTVANRKLLGLTNNGGIRFSLDNTESGDIWEFANNSSGSFHVSLAGTGGTEFKLATSGRFVTGPGGFAALDARPNGNLFIAGTLFQASDRNQKENFQFVNSEQILEIVSKLPITSWNYKSDDKTVRHMGPMAQDFREAFELGTDDKTIAPVDTAGVSLAAIQALHERMKSMQEQVTAKDEKIATLEADLNEMAHRMRQMEEAVEQLNQK